MSNPHHHALPAVHLHAHALAHHRSVPGAIGHGISTAAHHVATFLHHHAVASISVAALAGVVVLATVARGATHGAIVRLATWLSGSAAARPRRPPSGGTPA